MSEKKKGGSISLSELARIAGVSKMAVSFALRNKPGVSAQTRKRILELAARHHYTPDPRLSDLMAGLASTKDKYAVPIAWLNTDFDQDCWHRCPWLTAYLDGALKRCDALGYRLDEFWLEDEGMNAKRMSNILYHRGIRGVIVTPSRKRHIQHIDLDWSHFSTVTFMGAITTPAFHHVVSDYFQAMQLVLSKLEQYNYEKIGLALLMGTEIQSMHRYSGAFTYYQSQIPKSKRVPPLSYRKEKVKQVPEALLAQLQRWLHRNQPDVIICQDNDMLHMVQSLGYQVPRDIGIVHLAVDTDVHNWAGISSQKSDIGEEVVNLTASLLQGGHWGPPTTMRTLSIAGRWQDGDTIETGRS